MRRTLRLFSSVQPADRGAVGAAHVVVGDFELGLGLGQAVVAQQQVAVHLLAIRTRGAGVHAHQAAEGRRGAVIQETFIELAAGTVGARRATRVWLDVRQPR